MSKKKKTARELEAELDALADQMASLSMQLRDTRLLEQPTAPYAGPSSDQDHYKVLLRQMIGRKVLITVKGKHKGKIGTITRHAGSNTFKPINWYILLPDGSEVMKHRHSFKLLPRAAETASEEEDA